MTNEPESDSRRRSEEIPESGEGEVELPSEPREAGGDSRRVIHPADFRLVQTSLGVPSSAEWSEVTEEESSQERVSAERVSKARDELAGRLECVPRILAALNRKGSRLMTDDDLRDLSQDTVLKIWSKRGEFRGWSSVETWSYRFCYLEFLNRGRRLGRQRKREQALPGEDVLGADTPDLAKLIDLETLDTKLDELGPPASQVVRLKHFEHLTFTEIGGALSVSPNTAKTHYYRGIDWLRQRYQDGVSAPSATQEERRP